MPLVHVFASCGRFASEQAWQRYLMPCSGADGELLPSAFMLETGLADFEPACIESVRGDSTQALEVLLDGVSYGESWLAAAGAQAKGSLFDACVCIFAPNTLAHPARCSLAYLGAYRYLPDH